METLTSQIEDLKYQLAYSLAAIKIKNEELEAAHNGLRWWMDTFPLHVTEADNEEMLKLVKAIAIQPDYQALEQFAAKSGDLMRERIVETILASANGFPMREIRAIPSVTPEDMK